MATHKGERRNRSERRGGAERRVRETPVGHDRRTGGDRRRGLERRLELGTAGEQVRAAIGLLSYAVENGVMLEVDLWMLETAITRLQIALAKMGGQSGS